MDSYSSLINQILKNETLSKVISLWAKDADYLNLIGNDWKVHLENNVIFQNIQNNVNQQFKQCKSTYLKDYVFHPLNIEFPIIVAATCRFFKTESYNKNTETYNNKDLAIIIQECEPLDKISKVMLRDFGNEMEIKCEGKFTFDNNLISGCASCEEILHNLESSGFIIKKHTQPCVKDTYFYNGTNIVKTFGSVLQELFQQTFVALLKISIQNRYSYKNKIGEEIHRIGGKVQKMVTFHQAKLNPVIGLDDDLSDLTKSDDFTEILENCSEITNKSDTDKFNLFGNDTESPENGLLEKNAESPERHLLDVVNPPSEKCLFENMPSTAEKRFLEEETTILEAFPSTCKKQRTEDLIVKECWKELI